MLDLKFIRDNLDLVKRSIKARGLVLDIDKLIYLDDKRKKLITKIGELNAKRNENSSKMQENLDKVLKISLIETGKILKKTAYWSRRRAWKSICWFWPWK